MTQEGRFISTSPNARDKFKDIPRLETLNCPYFLNTTPPLRIHRAFSIGSSRLWSDESAMTFPPANATARESPTFAHSMWSSTRTHTQSVLPLFFMDAASDNSSKSLIVEVKAFDTVFTSGRSFVKYLRKVRRRRFFNIAETEEPPCPSNTAKRGGFECDDIKIRSSLWGLRPWMLHDPTWTFISTVFSFFCQWWLMSLMKPWNRKPKKKKISHHYNEQQKQQQEEEEKKNHFHS